MGKVLLVSVLLFSFLHATKSIGQFNHRIIYHSDDLGTSIESIIKNPKQQSRLVFNDTLSFYEHLNGLNAGKSGVIGKKLVHHSTLYHLTRQLQFEAVAFKGKYLISDDRTMSWILLKEVKYVLGYKCFAAISVTEKSDTTKAWYAPEIDQPFGPVRFNGLPGVVLEVQSQQSNWHLVAVKIEKTNHTLFFPRARIFTREEYLLRRKLNN